MIWQIALTIAVLTFIPGAIIGHIFGSPFPNEYTRGEYIGANMIIVGFVSFIVFLISWIWGI